MLIVRHVAPQWGKRFRLSSSCFTDTYVLLVLVPTTSQLMFIFYNERSLTDP